MHRDVKAVEETHYFFSGEPLRAPCLAGTKSSAAMKAPPAHLAPADPCRLEGRAEVPQRLIEQCITHSSKRTQGRR